MHTSTTLDNPQEDDAITCIHKYTHCYNNQYTKDQLSMPNKASCVFYTYLVFQQLIGTEKGLTKITTHAAGSDLLWSLNVLCSLAAVIQTGI